MAVAFDTLGLSQRLRASGIPEEQANELAMAAKSYIRNDDASDHLRVVTKEDLDAMELRITWKFFRLIVLCTVTLFALLQVTQ